MQYKSPLTGAIIMSCAAAFHRCTALIITRDGPQKSGHLAECVCAVGNIWHMAFL